MIPNAVRLPQKELPKILFETSGFNRRIRISGPLHEELRMRHNSAQPTSGETVMAI